MAQHKKAGRRSKRTLSPPAVKKRVAGDPPPDLKVPFGRRVRELRDAAGMTQRELAQASGISAVFLGTLERGEKAATIETVEKLARGLGVQPAKLFRFDTPAKEQRGADKLLRKLAGLIQDATDGQLARFERVARAFFEDD